MVFFPFFNTVEVKKEQRNIMDIQRLKMLFMWCTIINGILLFLSTIGFLLAPNMALEIHSTLFQIPKESVSEIIYILLGVYKIFWLVLNLVPYIALTIIAKDE
jgi:hypothetical protein